MFKKKKSFSPIMTFLILTLATVIVSGVLHLFNVQSEYASISKATDMNAMIITLIVTGLIASLTIGGKAIGKGIAINNSNKILLDFFNIFNFKINTIAITIGESIAPTNIIFFLLNILILLFQKKKAIKHNFLF